ncbi:hypothetical protein CANMA_001572 [Candida margitis]|uniref:uncharacterized protein n=1 Tax=Candida margitis TaxID=1775924 RepID=UPI00222778BF|nr:uncharacterized protein CANMA_001572 [Candida margitis]KAI5969504.1 hypothetical protein CANMA_001572 [Candida margitis]
MIHVSIVTGASRGIGKAIVDSILQTPGAKVVAIARSQTTLQSLKDKYGKDSFDFVAGDVTDENTAQKAIDVALTQFGQIDSIVANAGVLDPVGAINNTSIDDWKKLYDVNLFSIVQLIQLSLSELKRTKGNVVAVSSGAATKVYSGWYAYGSSKAALNHLIASLAAEEPSIQAISVAPGVVDTEMQQDIREKFGSNMSKEGLQRFIDLHEKKQLVPPEEPGRVYANLALKGWPSELNGQFLRYNDEKLVKYQ